MRPSSVRRGRRHRRAPMAVLVILAAAVAACGRVGSRVEMAAPSVVTAAVDDGTAPGGGRDAGRGPVAGGTGRAPSLQERLLEPARADNAARQAAGQIALPGSAVATGPPVTDPVPAGPGPVAGVPAAPVVPPADAEPTGAERVALVQRLLLARGYGIEQTDGELDAATTAALAAFQAEAGLPADGAADGATFEALRRSSAGVAAQLPAAAVVDLSDQRLYVFNAAGQLITFWPVSTGGPGSETPTGSFAVEGRIRVGTAKSSEVVHMDFFTVFNGDIGFHGIPWVGSRDDRLWTPLGEYGVSHGCVRMDDANARYLFDFLADGSPVTVQD